MPRPRPSFRARHPVPLLLAALLPAALLQTLAACQPPPPPRATTFVGVEGGRFRILGRTNGWPTVDIRGAEAAVRVDGVRRGTSTGNCTPTAEVLLSCDLDDGLVLELRSQPEDGGVLLVASVRSTRGAHRVEGFELISTAGTEDSGLFLPRSARGLRYLHNGYQSWSFAGALEVPEGYELPRRDGAIEYRAPNGNVSDSERLGLSSHSVVLDAGGAAMALGFVSTRLWQGAIALESPEHHRLTVQSGFTGDSVALAPGGRVDSETLFIQFALDAEQAMNAYGRALQLRQPVRDPPGGVLQRGWFSWNRFFEGIDEPTLLAQSALLREEFGSSGFDLVELDDGWQAEWGAWEPNEKFRPIPELVSELRLRQQRLGLWLAPFVVATKLPVVEANPDWWVKRRDGAPLEHNPVGTPHRLRVVDLTHPEARAWAVGHLARLAEEGVDFFKLDFLYAAALDGLRHDPAATGVSALETGLRAVFEALGSKTVNLCGVPWLHAALAPPSTLRIGPDVAFKVGPYGFVFVANAARNLAARAFGPLTLRSDVDQFWLAPLDDAQTRTAALLQAMTAETFALADDLGELRPGQLDALRYLAKLGPPAAGAGRSPSLAARRVFEYVGEEHPGASILELLTNPSRVSFRPPSVLVRGDRLAVTNWSDEPAEVELPLLPGETVHPLWGATPEGGRILLPAHDSALLRIDSP